MTKTSRQSKRQMRFEAKLPEELHFKNKKGKNITLKKKHDKQRTKGSKYA